jgi:ADP-ribose pyrophosphatase
LDIFKVRKPMSDPTPPAGAPGLISRRPVHKGRIVDLGVDTVRFPDGSTGELELIRHSGAAAVLPVLGDPAGGDPQIVLIRQYRYAAGGYLYEVPAGRPDRPGRAVGGVRETRAPRRNGAHRGLHPLPHHHLDHAGLHGRADPPLPGHRLTSARRRSTPTSSWRRCPFPMSEALRMVRDGEITDGKTICTLLYAAGFVMGM